MDYVLSFLMNHPLPILVCVLAIISIALAPRATSNGAFFEGLSPLGKTPGLWMLTFSQVTTWIFARSLMNAAILGFYYGIWGTIAYAAYYLSFFIGGKIIDHLRFEHGHNSVQDFLRARFGGLGTSCYNIVVGLRLVSEVFANVLVIGVLFGAAGSNTYMIAVLLFSVVTLGYSLFGGLYASLRTDFFQMSLFLGLLCVLIIAVLFGGQVSTGDLFFKPFNITEPGPILLMVALLQVWSYPMHDPVMMDRGFLADRETTKSSFHLAGIISIICIMLFGILGVFAGSHAETGQKMPEVLEALLGPALMLLFNAVLVISAMSTLDSTLSSSAKLVSVDMKLIEPTLNNGRTVMVLFMVLGLALVFLGNKDLFSAVAVSGTASMYLMPVILFSLWGKQLNIPQWSYLGSFIASMIGAVLYFTESSGHTAILGDAHKYTKLLWICLTLVVVNNGLFFLGSKTSPEPVAQ